MFILYLWSFQPSQQSTVHPELLYHIPLKCPDVVPMSLLTYLFIQRIVIAEKFDLFKKAFLQSFMHIFIDESGNFVITGSIPKISSITALIIPDRYIDRLTKKFIELRKSWGYDREVKGSKLHEKQVSETIVLLRIHDVL